MKKVNKNELISAMVNSANGSGTVFILENNIGNIEIWVSTASNSSIEMGGYDILYSSDFSHWKNTDEDLDEADVDYYFDSADIESDLNEHGIEVE